MPCGSGTRSPACRGTSTATRSGWSTRRSPRPCFTRRTGSSPSRRPRSSRPTPSTRVSETRNGAAAGSLRSVGSTRTGCAWSSRGSPPGTPSGTTRCSSGSPTSSRSAPTSPPARRARSFSPRHSPGSRIPTTSSPCSTGATAPPSTPSMTPSRTGRTMRLSRSGWPDPASCSTRTSPRPRSTPWRPAHPTASWSGRSVNQYEHPLDIKTRGFLRTTGDVFPYAESQSRRVDNDHPDPYRPNGPPGQTGDHNHAPLGRRHHRAKTHQNYQVFQVGYGRYLWRTPHGLWRLVDGSGTHEVEPGP